MSKPIHICNSEGRIMSQILIGGWKSKILSDRLAENSQLEDIVISKTDHVH